MSKYKPGDKFILELTGVDDSGSRTLYEVKGLSGLCSENMLDKLEKIVQCKDCEHWGVGNCIPEETEQAKSCEYGLYMVGASGYCVYGKDDLK